MRIRNGSCHLVAVWNYLVQILWKVIAVMQVIHQLSCSLLQSDGMAEYIYPLYSADFNTSTWIFFLCMFYIFLKGTRLRAMAQRKDPIIRTGFTWLAGNLPLGWKSNYCLWKANLASDTSGVFSLYQRERYPGALSRAWRFYCFPSP